MANDRHDPTIHWIDPIRRGVLPIADFKIPRRLRRTARQRPFEIRVDTAFARVIRSCAESMPDRPRTWLNDELITAYCQLNQRGHAHSVECWQEGRLVGGLYGVSLGSAFFGESMFSRERDASKIALVELVARLQKADFMLLDTQFVTEHLRQFGAQEIPRVAYKRLLDGALLEERKFPRQPGWYSGSLINSSLQ